MDMGLLNGTDLVGLAGAPLVLALVQLARVTFPALPTRFLPALTLVIAILLNLGLATVTGAGSVSVVLVGMITGLMASGLYSHAVVGRASLGTSSSGPADGSFTSGGAALTSGGVGVTSPTSAAGGPELVARLVRTGVLAVDREPWAWRPGSTTGASRSARSGGAVLGVAGE